jgi:hypothetical protein
VTVAERKQSFHTFEGPPAAILTDGIVPVFLHAVTAMTLTQAYQLPPIGSTASRVLVDTHSDTISLSGVLLGPDRFVRKLALETIAESGKRGGAGLVALASKAFDVSGLVLITAMSIRTDMQIQQLTFGASATKRDAIDVSIQLAHMPPPGARTKLLDLASVGVSTMTGW